MKTDELDSRSRDILRQAVHTFITSGEPVGSRTLAKLYPYRLSPATIRNVMSDLEETGYFYQPHTSAGRVPTDKGYRFYVSTLVKGAELSWVEQEMIGSSLRRADLDVEVLAKKTTRLLSHMTNMVSFVIGPDFQQSSLRHIDFVKLAPRRILVVLVSQTGQAINRVAQIPEDLSGEELEKCARYLTEEFKNFTLFEIREALLSRMREMRAIYNRLVEKALTLGSVAFAEALAPPDVHLEGASRMLDRPEFKTNLERARHLLSILEEKGRLVEILNACLEDEGLHIVIGSEARVPDMEGLSLIASGYRYRDRELGSLGIVGPTRMEYARLMSVVDYFARAVSDVLSQTGGETSN